MIRSGSALPLAFVLLGLVAGRSFAQQVDLVDAKQDQDARLTDLQTKLANEQQKGNADAVQKLLQQIDAVRAEDLWAKTDGSPAVELQAGEGFRPFSFAVLSDLHLPERKGIARFERAIELLSKRKDIAFVLVLGDIVWDRKPEGLKEKIAKAGIPVHLVYGNNDWKWIKDGSLEANFGPRDYTFTYANCTFVQMWDCLPKDNPENHKGDFSPTQWEWLEQQLDRAQKAGATHTFVSMHVPPTTPGAYNNLFFMFTKTEERFLGLLEKYHVTAGLFGHLHQAAAWKHGEIQCYVTPSCCWNFISKTQKVDSSFVRIVKVEKDRISDALIPVRLEGETFTWDTLDKFYDKATAPK